MGNPTIEMALRCAGNVRDSGLVEVHVDVQSNRGGLAITQHVLLVSTFINSLLFGFIDLQLIENMSKKI